MDLPPKVHNINTCLFISEGEFPLSVLQRSVVHPLFNQAVLGWGGCFRRLLWLCLLMEIIRSWGWLVSAWKKGTQNAAKLQANCQRKWSPKLKWMMNKTSFKITRKYWVSAWAHNTSCFKWNGKKKEKSVYVANWCEMCEMWSVHWLSLSLVQHLSHKPVHRNSVCSLVARFKPGCWAWALFMTVVVCIWSDTTQTHLAAWQKHHWLSSWNDLRPQMQPGNVTQSESRELHHNTRPCFFCGCKRLLNIQWNTTSIHMSDGLTAAIMFISIWSPCLYTEKKCDDLVGTIVCTPFPLLLHR